MKPLMKFMFDAWKLDVKKVDKCTWNAWGENIAYKVLYKNWP